MVHLAQVCYDQSLLYGLKEKAFSWFDAVSKKLRLVSEAAYMQHSVKEEMSFWSHFVRKAKRELTDEEALRVFNEYLLPNYRIVKGNNQMVYLTVDITGVINELYIGQGTGNQREIILRERRIVGSNSQLPVFVDIYDDLTDQNKECVRILQKKPDLTVQEKGKTIKVTINYNNEQKIKKIETYFSDDRWSVPFGDSDGIKKYDSFWQTDLSLSGQVLYGEERRMALYTVYKRVCSLSTYWKRNPSD